MRLRVNLKIEYAEFDKAIANGDVRIVRGDDGKIHTEALDFG